MKPVEIKPPEFLPFTDVPTPDQALEAGRYLLARMYFDGINPSESTVHRILTGDNFSVESIAVNAVGSALASELAALPHRTRKQVNNSMFIVAMRYPHFAELAEQVA